MALDRLAKEEVVVRHGVRVAVPVRAAADGLRRSQNLVEAVVLADTAAHAGVLDLRVLTAYCAGLVGYRGIRRARRACALASPASRSPWETRLRIFYLDVAGLPAPLVNVPIFDRRTGRLVGIADLFDDEAATVTEFDGQHHRERRQHRDDNVREEALEALNLVVSRADSLDLRQHPAELAARLRSAHRRGLSRDRSRDRWTLEEPAWYRRHEAGPTYELTDVEKAEVFGRYPRNA